MATGENVLYGVARRHWLGGATLDIKIFRTREAARSYKKIKQSNKRNKHSRYEVLRATWGPEQ